MKIDYENAPHGKQPVSFTMTRPDDMHLHVRDGIAMKSVIGYSTWQFARAIIMPNLKPPITTVDQALDYRVRILEALPFLGWERNFNPLMTLYLTDATTVADIREAKASGLVHGVKYYPANATTNSAAGVSDVSRVYRVLEEMEKQGVPLLLHGEVTDASVDVFDREQWFIGFVLLGLLHKFPNLRIVLEHITTKHAVDVVLKHGNNLAATITAHHLLANRNDMLADGIKTHYYCKPILKTQEDQWALQQAAMSGNPKFFLGTDSAPHPRNGDPGKAKETACGCAGCFTAPHALELYTEAFDSAGKLDKLEGFASHFGADFYGLPRSGEKVTLVREEWKVPDELPFGDSVVVPFRAGETMRWKMK